MSKKKKKKSRIEKQSETKEEKVVFQNNKKAEQESKTETQIVEPVKETNKETIKEPVKEENKETSKEPAKEKAKEASKEPVKEETPKNAEETKQEILENKENKKRKAGAIVIILISVLFIILIFSTIFAMIHSTKNTVAKGVRINGIDISGLTYEEARDKLDEAFKTILDVEIELSYKDYQYKVKAEDVGLAYDFQKELDEAYSIGRRGNLLQCNYQLIGAAFIGKDLKIDYKYNNADVDSLVDEVSKSVPGLVKDYSYYIEDDNLIINPGEDGIQVEKTKLKEKIVRDLNNRNPLSIVEYFKNEKETIPCKFVKAEQIDIDKVYAEVHTTPENAYFIAATDTSKAKIFADVDGIDFAISIDEAKEKLKEEATEYVIPLSRQKAEVTINDIGLEAFPNKLQEFSTRYDASNWGRSENLKIATDKISGTVLMPGDQFSFNGVVGERTVQAGYKNAAIFQGDQVVDGLAGGICQVSSTLYNAALLSNLQIDERYNHSFKTSYLEFGRDATVVYGVKDLKFTNTRSYPIKIEGSAENGVVTFTIYGIEEEEEYKINIIPVITSTIPYTTQTIVDNSLAPGSQQVYQGGYSGAKVTTYKEKVLNGTVVSKEVITNDTYKAMTRIVKKGPDAVPVVETPAPVVEEQPVEQPELQPEPVQESQPEVQETSNENQENGGAEQTP